MFSSCHQLQQAPGRLDPGAFHLLPTPARKFPQKTLTNPCPSGNIYRQSVRLRIEYGRVPEWPMGTDCKSAAFSFGGSNPPAPTKKTSVENTLVFCFIRYLKFHSQGWIRTAAATSLKTAQKQPSGLFLAARLATSTRAHQEIQYPNRVLDFLFCRHFFRTGRDDRCQWQKQGGEAGAALRFFKALPRGLQKKRQAQLVRPAEWSGGQKSPCGAFLDARLAKFMKNAQTKTTVRVDGGSVIA